MGRASLPPATWPATAIAPSASFHPLPEKNKNKKILCLLIEMAVTALDINF